MVDLSSLPILPLSKHQAAFFELLKAPCSLLEAEPGAGKSTLAPLWALSTLTGQQQIIVVQPRVLAAEALATRLAHMLGENVGQQVGFQVPFHQKTSTQTRLIFMTPGVLLQRLLADPLLENISMVMLDEIHERALFQDLAWVLLQEVLILRDDFKLMLMSATPDASLRNHIGARLFAEGRCYPVTVNYQPEKNRETLAEQVVRAIRQLEGASNETGLVFLPGWRDIDAVSQAVAQHFPQIACYRLHSQVSSAEQHQALDAAQGPRIILATNIAETSLTIADVKWVIDSGLVRRAAFEQKTGLTRLKTSRISQASAEQRRGRAGRVSAGRCIRLWSQDAMLAPADLPEIRSVDYLPLALMLAHWGSSVEDLLWLEKPNYLAFEKSVTQLQRWQLISAQGAITEQGRQVSRLGTHPQIAVLLFASIQQQKISREAINLSLALHFDAAMPETMDDWLNGQALKPLRHVELQRARFLRVLAVEQTESPLGINTLSKVLPFRIGCRQDSGRYRLNSGISVEPLNPVDSRWYLFMAIAPRYKSHVGVGFALQLNPEQIQALAEQQKSLVHHQGRWHWRCDYLMGGAVVEQRFIPLEDRAVSAALIMHINQQFDEITFESLLLNSSAQHLLGRARLLAQYGALALPVLSTLALYQTLDQWLAPFLDQRTQLTDLPFKAALEFLLGFEVIQAIDRLLPTSVTLPSGRKVSVTIGSDGTIEVCAKLQEFFGCKNLDFAEGKIPLKIHLLAPNGSPLAITSNLETFWRQGYPDVRKTTRGRYPRHPWPENPLEHQATALTNKRLRDQQNNAKT